MITICFLFCLIPILVEVNINFEGFQGDVIIIPENNEQGMLQVNLTEAVNTEPVSFEELFP